MHIQTHISTHKHEHKTDKDKARAQKNRPSPLKRKSPPQTFGYTDLSTQDHTQWELNMATTCSETSDKYVLSALGLQACSLQCWTRE